MKNWGGLRNEESNENKLDIRRKREQNEKKVRFERMKKTMKKNGGLKKNEKQ